MSAVDRGVASLRDHMVLAWLFAFLGIAGLTISFQHSKETWAAPTGSFSVVLICWALMQANHAGAEEARTLYFPFIARPERHADLLHWLLFDDERRVVGCQCGFRANVEEDEGHGDSVVHHLIQVGVQGP